MNTYTNSYNEDTNVLTIYEGNNVLATLEDVSEDRIEHQKIMADVVFELREVDLVKELAKETISPLVELIKLLEPSDENTETLVSALDVLCEI